MLATLACLAPGEAWPQSFRMAPYVVVSESYSDNIGLVPEPAARSGWVTELAPGIRIQSTGARVKGALDFRVASTRYSGQSQLDDTVKFLNSNVRVEALENLLYVDARADVTQQNRSAFGTVSSPDRLSASANRLETTSFQVAPFLRGFISDAAVYQVRFNAARVRTSDDTLPDLRSSEWVARLGNASRAARLGWALDATSLRFRSDAGGEVSDHRARASLTYAVVPQFQVALSEGWESSDFASSERQKRSTPGVGFLWQPTQRTQVDGLLERRFFGDGHVVSVRHRTPRTAWSLASSREATALPTRFGKADWRPLQSLVAEQLTSAVPDPGEREQAARRRLEEFAIPALSALGSDVFTAQPYLLRSDSAAVALLGVTNAIALSWSRREQRSFDRGLPAGTADDYRQSGFNASLSHRITALTTVTLGATRLRSADLAGAGRRTTQEEYRLGLTSRIGPRTNASLGVRHVDFSGQTAAESYRENAFFGAVSVSM